MTNYLALTGKKRLNFTLLFFNIKNATFYSVK